MQEIERRSERLRDVLDDVFELLPDRPQTSEPRGVVTVRGVDSVRALRVVVSPVRAGALDVQDGLAQVAEARGVTVEQAKEVSAA